MIKLSSILFRYLPVFLTLSSVILFFSQAEARTSCLKEARVRKCFEDQGFTCKQKNSKGSLTCSNQDPSATNKTSRLKLRGPIINYPGFTSIDFSFDRGIVRLKKGSRFATFLLTPVSSNTSKVGDSVSAMILSPIDMNNRTIVPSGSLLKGWISRVCSERSVLHSKFSSTRWRNAHAALAIHFDELHMPGKRVLKIKATPAKNTPVSSVGGEFPLIVNDTNEIELDFSGAKYGALGIAIQATSWATGPFKLVVGPVLSGTTGAIAPAYALDRPVNDPEARRIDGLLNGIVKGLPGGGLYLGAKHKGISVDLAKGTELQVELDQDLVVIESTDHSSK